MHHKIPQVSSRSDHVSCIFIVQNSVSVLAGVSYRTLLQLPGGSSIKLNRGAVATGRFAIISRGHAVQQLLLDDDISRLQDVEMTIGKIFSRSRPIEFLIQRVSWGFGDKKGGGSEWAVSCC
jgi:hypothetical protein